MSTLAAMLVAQSQAQTQAYVSDPAMAVISGATCMPRPDNVIVLKWNMYSSEWGGYEVDGCVGVNPKLQLTAGTTYTFDQSDATNWYHPVGFAYIAGGAHTSCRAANGVAGECPELGGETPSSTIQYYINGAAVTTDASGFGLDAYEPLFFNSQDWWGAQNSAHAYQATLTIPANAAYTRIYYFCHVHSGMSAEIDIVGSSATSTTVINAAVLGGETEASALAIYTSIRASEQRALSTFDAACGTHATSAFDASGSHSTCANKHFLCGAGSTGAFEQCLVAVDCQMHHDMAVSVTPSTSAFATFARQMIAHHQNAVAMSKVLARHHVAADYPAAGTADQDMAWAQGLIRNIINVQNFQIQQMQAWLDANPTLASTSSNCYDSAMGSTCGEIKAAYQASSCCGSNLQRVTNYSIA